MSRAEKIRGKLFGSGDKASNGEDVSVSRSSSDVPLTIQIPKPPPTQPAPPKNKADKADSSPRSPRAEPAQRPDKCFRERLVQKLGANYHGAERYRLAQDATKEVHWKRWGPYVSDRQWVSLPLLIDVSDVHRDPRVGVSHQTRSDASENRPARERSSFASSQRAYKAVSARCASRAAFVLCSQCSPLLTGHRA